MLIKSTFLRVVSLSLVFLLSGSVLAAKDSSSKKATPSKSWSGGFKASPKTSTPTYKSTSGGSEKKANSTSFGSFGGRATPSNTPSANSTAFKRMETDAAKTAAIRTYDARKAAVVGGLGAAAVAGGAVNSIKTESPETTESKSTNNYASDRWQSREQPAARSDGGVLMPLAVGYALGKATSNNEARQRADVVTDDEQNQSNVVSASGVDSADVNTDLSGELESMKPFPPLQRRPIVVNGSSPSKDMGTMFDVFAVVFGLVLLIGVFALMFPSLLDKMSALTSSKTKKPTYSLE